MSEKKEEYKTKAPRPEDIKVTKIKPTIEELKEYRAAWLKEAEDNGTIDDLFLIVKSFGEIPERGIHKGWQPLRRFEFTDGDSDYVILFDRALWGMGKDDLVTWERIYVVEDGDYMHEIEYGNKRLVQYYRRLEADPSGRDDSESDAKIIEGNIYVPGYWEGLIGVFAGDARDEINKGKKKKVTNERNDLLEDLNLT